MKPQFSVDDGRELVARPVALDIERRDLQAEVFLELLFGPEDEPAHLGMQSVGPNDEIELPCYPALEGNMDSASGVLDGVYRLAENELDATVSSGMMPIRSATS